MNKKIGNRVRKLIYAKGFSSIRKFADYLERVEPENYVTEDTIFNVIKGKNMRNDTLKVIADGLGVSMDCLTSDDVPIAEDYLMYEVEAEENTEEHCEEHRMRMRRIYNNLYDISRRFYPADVGDIYLDNHYRITTLAEFGIYLPLLEMWDVMEVISRIGGCVKGFEIYTLEQYRWLYRRIPDSPAKRYADYQANSIRLANKKNLNDQEKKMKLELEQFENSESFEAGEKHYLEVTASLRAKYRTEMLERRKRLKVNNG